MTGEQRIWRRTFWVSALLALMLLASLAPYLAKPTEIVRLRNALLYEPVVVDADWTPADLPAGYLVERAAPAPSFQRIVEINGLLVPGNDWETALRIGRHLVHNADASGRSGPIQLGLSQTYRRITEGGDGYCADYVDVFTALATTAGVFTRSWAFSFDGFGGHGHIFNEIWDRQSGRWRMIDVFNNYYFVDADGEPLSALEFRAALLGSNQMHMRAIDSAARPGYKYPQKALDYYRRGISQWYLWWGNNVFAYESNGLVEVSSSAGRSVGQMAGILAGVQPPIRILQEPDNEAQRVRLVTLKYQLFVTMAALPLLLAIMFFSLWRGRRARRAAQGLVSEK